MGNEEWGLKQGFKESWRDKGCFGGCCRGKPDQAEWPRGSRVREVGNWGVKTNGGWVWECRNGVGNRQAGRAKLWFGE